MSVAVGERRDPREREDLENERDTDHITSGIVSLLVDAPSDASVERVDAFFDYHARQQQQARATLPAAPIIPRALEDACLLAPEHTWHSPQMWLP